MPSAYDTDNNVATLSVKSTGTDLDKCGPDGFGWPNPQWENTPGRRSTKELIEQARREGFNAGYEACIREQVVEHTALNDPEIADRIVVERLAAVLKALRDAA